MKAAFESLITSQMNSFLIRRFEEKSFSAPYHFHPELELTFIVNGTGKRYVGTNMQNFYPGDFVLLGANVPHCWKSDKMKRKQTCSSIVIQFLPNFLGDVFFEKPELKTVFQLLQKSNSGLRFITNIDVYKTKMEGLLQEQDSCKRLLLFLDLLYQLSLIKKYTLLDKQKQHTLLSNGEQQRIQIVMSYIIENFKKEVSLSDAAKTINMTPQSFCKYFKRLTRKTFIETVTDYRIDFAAQQLVQTEFPISQIGYGCGFNDISHFHKTFKERMNSSPLQYRNAFLKNQS